MSLSCAAGKGIRIFVAALLWLVGWAPAQDQWAMQTLAVSGPAPREGAAMVALAPGGGLLLFGGRDLYASGGPVYFADTWRFDGSSWTQLQPLHAPPARARHAMVGDASGGAVLAGGAGPSGNLDDAWRWDGADWVALPAPPSTGFAGSGLGFDPVRGVVVLPMSAGVDEWDGNSWRHVAAGLAPDWIDGNGGFDRGHQRLVFWCRNASGCVLRSWDGQQWSQPLVTLLTAYSRVPVTWWDGQQQRISALMQRGTTTDGALWVQWPNGYVQQMLSTSLTGPGLAAAAVEDDGRLFVFGGNDSVGRATGTMRILQSTSLRPWSVTAFGSGCGGGSGTPELSPVVGYPPLLCGSTSNAPGLRLRLSHQAPNTWNLAYLAFGWSNTQWNAWVLPWSLGPMGAPGCTAWVAGEVFLNVRNFGDPSYFSMPLPYVPQAVGSSTFVQALVFDVTAPNAIGLTTSGALELVLGLR